MDQNPQNSSVENPLSSESFGNVPNPSESFGNVRNDSESFRTIPKGSETFGKVPKGSERKENHTLTVREAARMFETAGVARTERSIINWCQPNKHGLTRLDCYFDPNEQRYYLTAQSVEMVIQEEKDRAARRNEPSEPVGNVPKASETAQDAMPASMESDTSRMRELEKEVFDLMITNRGKDFFIEQLQKERIGYLQEVAKAHRKVGELETKLLQLQSPSAPGPSVEMSS